MSSFAKISIRFGADLKGFSSAVQNVQRDLEKVGRKMQNIGAGLTVGLTLPILALGAKSVSAFNEQAQALAQVEAGIKSTGGAAGIASKELQKMASDLQSKTLFGDEAILKDATAQLLTFTNIAGENFKRTQVAALDLATRLDGDLKSASIQLGKALNDPVANLSALSRSGIQFSQDQKATINSLVETNRLADAQAIILDELAKQYGGAAEAAAKAGTGPLQQFQAILGDITEQFGELILEYLNPLAIRLKTMAEGFTSLSSATKKTILIIAGLAAALGPVLVILGTLATTVIPAVGAALTVLSGPVGLIAAALAGIAIIVIKNWEPIKSQLQEIQNYFIDLYNESVAFRIAVEGIILVFNSVYNVVKLVLDFIVSGFTNAIDLLLGSFENLGAGIKAALTGDIKGIFAAVTQQGKLAADEFGGIFRDLGGDIENFTTNMKNDFNTALDAVTTKKKISFTESNVDASAIQNAVANAVNNGLVPGGGPSTPQVAALDFSGLQQGLAPIQTSPLDLVAEQMPLQVEQMNQAQLLALDNAMDFNQGFTSIIEETAQNFAIGFGQLLGNMLAGTAGIQDLGSLMIGALADMAIRVGELAIKIGLTLKGVKLALANLNPVLAVAAGVALVALGTLLKSGMANAASGRGGGGATAFANGGIVSGPTYALVGEYAGARNNPEVIAPLDKLKAMISDVVGGGGGELSGSVELFLSGRNLKGSLDRTNAFIGRRK